MIANRCRFFDRCRVAGDEPIVGLCTEAVDDTACQLPLRAIGVLDLDELELQSRAAAIQYENLHNAHPTCFFYHPAKQIFIVCPCARRNCAVAARLREPMTSVSTMQQDFPSLPLRRAKAALESS